MRTVLSALLGSALLASPLRAGLPPQFGDAALHAVQFLDPHEGWAVGEDGVIWHTIDGGRAWERQPTGARASLRSLHFLTPYTGWVVGREELPEGGGSTGIILFTQDGGLRWQHGAGFTLPSLNAVRFLDDKTGYVAGDGTDKFPTGVFITRDGGRNWKPIKGPRFPSWSAIDLRDDKTGALAGAWNRLGLLRDGELMAADVDILGGRTLRGLQLTKNQALAVGQGGLVFLSDTAGARWGYADLPFPAEVRANWDFHAVHGVGERLWIAGRPGSKILHSPDGGKSWEVQNTGQPLPLNGVFFIDDKRGWAVGEFGTILNTSDGGATWKIQRRGGHRAAVLFVHSRSNMFPVDTVAVLGGQEGYLTAGIQVQAADSASSAPSRAADGNRLAAALRQVGGAAAEMMWHFPVPEHLAHVGKAELLQNWDRLHADRAAEQLLRQLILAIRVWKPNVVITDHPDARVTGYPGDALLAAAVREAFTRAADPQVFPEQIQNLGLEPWQPDKLYALWEGRTGSHITMDLHEPQANLEATAHDFATPAAALLSDQPPLLPAQRYYRLLESRLDGANTHKDLLEGISLSPHGPARRDVKQVTANAESVKAGRTRRNLQALADTPAAELTDPGKLLAQIGPMLQMLPDEQGAAAAFAVANQYARIGQWAFAREVFLLLVDRYPAHPLVADGYRWLIRHNTSSEARRRQELGQFLLLGETTFQNNPAEGSIIPGELSRKVTATVKGVETTQVQATAVSGLTNRAQTRRWFEQSLEIGKKLEALGPIYATDPSIQLCLQAARRQLGDHEGAKEGYVQFCKEHPSGPWPPRSSGWRTAPAGRRNPWPSAGRPLRNHSWMVHSMMPAGMGSPPWFCRTPSALRRRNIPPRPGWPTITNTCISPCAAGIPKVDMSLR